MSAKDFLNFKQYYQDAEKILHTNDFYHKFITRKVIHSFLVYRTGRNIIKQTPELSKQSKDFQNKAYQALLFHDVGRFKEAELRYEAEQQNQDIPASSLLFNHGDIGYNLLKEDKRYNDSRILAAVKYHGLMMEDVYADSLWQNLMKLPKKDEIQQILKLVRDADKLANLFTIKEFNHLSEDIFYKKLTEELKIALPSAEVLEQFFSEKTIRFATVKSWADRILMVLSWIYDINYPPSLRMFCDLHYDDYLLNELSKINKNSVLQEEISQKTKQFLSAKA